MATSFQPDDQHPKARTSTSSTSIIVTAVLVALAVIMLFALAVPRLSGDDGTNWLLTIGAGVLAFALVFAVGFARSKGRSENPPAATNVSDPADQSGRERPSSTSATS